MNTEPKKRGRPASGNPMVSVHLRIPTDMFDFFRELGPYSPAMREALRQYMEQK
jgi:uncharacterized protein (DUF4415 family)